MTGFSKLPTELWLLIAAEFSYGQLFKLRSLNSFFFNYWLDTRWKETTVDINSDSSVRRLKMVVDPLVASRLKTLRIHLGLSAVGSRSSKLQKLDTVAVLLHSLNLLPSIASIHILISQGISYYVLAIFFETFISLSVARTLQDLSLRGRMEMFAWLWEYSAHHTPFRSLTKLNLELFPGDHLSAQTASSLALSPFFRSLSPTLRSLSIVILDHKFAPDLSPLFDALCSQPDSSVFPNLTTLFLDLFLDQTFRFSPESLSRFLLTHNNLRHLHLKTRSESGVWFSKLINENYQLPFLQTLHILPSVTQTGLSALLTLIKRTTRTLSSLTILERCLTLQEAEDVVYALTEDDQETTMTPEPRKLKSLTMTVYKISVPFLDLLARKLPQLEHLNLNVTKLISSAQGPFYDHLQLRRYDLNVPCTQDVLHTWKLHDLTVRLNMRRNSKAQADRVLRAVADAVPALAHAMSRK